MSPVPYQRSAFMITLLERVPLRRPRSRHCVAQATQRTVAPGRTLKKARWKQTRSNGQARWNAARWAKNSPATARTRVDGGAAGDCPARLHGGSERNFDGGRVKLLVPAAEARDVAVTLCV